MSVEGGKGSPINISAKQKQNTGSLTTAELVGVDCAPPLAPWAPSFLKEQGHEVRENVVKQDNESAVLLVKNRKVRSGKECEPSMSNVFTQWTKLNVGMHKFRAVTWMT